MKLVNRYSSILALAGLALVATHSAQAASFSDQQIKEHPCLDNTSLPWRISPIKTAEIPEAYKGWTGVWSGHWIGGSGKICHTLILEEIQADGAVKLLYSVGQPYSEYVRVTGTIQKTEKGQQLEAVLSNGTRVKYTLTATTGDNPSPMLDGLYGGFTGGELKPVKATDN